MLATAARTTLGETLEAERLRHRARRLRLVVARLRDRVEERRRRGESVPAPLWEAVHGFEVELGSVRQRLDEVDRCA